MFKDLFRSIGDCFSALGFVFENRMAHFFLYPIVVTILLSIGLIAGISSLVELMKEYVDAHWSFNSVVPADEGFWQMVWRWIKDFSDMALSKVIEWIVAIGLYYLFHKMMKYIVLVLMSPVMSLISERTEEKLTGREYPFDWGQFFKDIWRGVLIAGRNFAIEMFIVLAVWAVNLVLLVFVPPVGMITTFLGAIFTWIVGAYFYGFATMDYTNERRRLSIKESVAFIRRNRGIAIGNGLVFSAVMAVPIIGAYVGPVFAIIMCTVGAVLTIHNKVDLDREDFYLKPTGNSADDQLTTNENVGG